MNNNTTVVADSLHQPNLHTGNQPDGDFTGYQSNLTTTKKVIRIAKKGPMHPTPLYVPFCFFSVLIKSILF